MENKELILFHETFKRLYPKLFNFSSYYIYERDDAREIVQDVFLKLWEGNYDIADLKEKGGLDSLLFTMVKNKSLDYIKHKKVVLRYNENKRDEFIKSSISEYTLSDESSLNFLIDKDIERAISKAISELPKPIQKAFVMSRYHNLTYKEIASQLDISEKTVEYRISFALKELRVKLSPYCYMMLILSMSKIILD